MLGRIPVLREHQPEEAFNEMLAAIFLSLVVSE